MYKEISDPYIVVLHTPNDNSPQCLIEERMVLLTDDTRFFWIGTMRIGSIEEILIEVVDWAGDLGVFWMGQDIIEDILVTST